MGLLVVFSCPSEAPLPQPERDAAPEGEEGLGIFRGFTSAALDGLKRAGGPCLRPLPSMAPAVSACREPHEAGAQGHHLARD